MFLVFVFFATLWMFYDPLLDSYFFSDDIPWIWFSATKSVAQIFFSPEHSRAISGSNFTPMLGLSYKIDWLLFKMDPQGYALHNLFAVLLSGAAFFSLLRHYSNSSAGLAGLVLFTLSPVTLSVFSWSATRHYSEGLFFALITVHLYLKKSTTGRSSVPGAVFYLVAALFKEIYVVLPAILFFVTKGSIGRRMRNTAHFWAVFVIYFFWRFWMLRGMGGYQSFRPLDFKAGLYRIIEFLPQHLLGPFHLLFWALAIIMFLTVKRKTGTLVPVIIIGILLVPVVPVGSLIGLDYTWARYVFHISVFLIFAGVLWGNECLDQKGPKRAVAVIVLTSVMALFAVRDAGIKNFVHQERDVSGRTAMEFISSGAQFMAPVQLPYFYNWLADIYEYLYGKKIMTKVLPEKALLKYISQNRRAEIVSSGLALEVYDDRAFRRGLLEGHVQMQGYRIKWKLGPYPRGRYYLLNGRYSGLYTSMTEVKSEGDYLFGKNYPDQRLEVYYMKALYQSPEGWEVISDEFKLEIPQKVRIDIKGSD